MIVCSCVFDEVCVCVCVTSSSCACYIVSTKFRGQRFPWTWGFSHVSEEMDSRILILKHFFHFHPATSRSTSHPLFFLTFAVSLLMLWTENQLEELVWGLNYEPILGFCLLCPKVCPHLYQHFILEEGGGAGVERRGGGVAEGFVGNVNDKTSHYNAVFPPFALILTLFLRSSLLFSFLCSFLLYSFALVSLSFYSICFPSKSLLCIFHENMLVLQINLPVCPYKMQNNPPNRFVCSLSPLLI